MTIKELSCLVLGILKQSPGHSEESSVVMWQKDKEELLVSELLITLVAIAFMFC